jgi:hypothetical protein
MSTNDVPLEGNSTMYGKEIDDLMQQLETLTLSEWYLDLNVHVPKIEAMLHVVAKDAPWVHLLTSRACEVHMQACHQACNDC